MGKKKRIHITNGRKQIPESFQTVVSKQDLSYVSV